MSKISDKSNNKKRLLDNFLSLSVLQIFSLVLPLLTLPYLVRVLGVENYGLVMFAQSFIMFFIILVDYGFNLSATREIAIHRDNKNKVTEIYSSAIVIKVVLLLVSFLLLIILVNTIKKFRIDKELYYFTFLIVVGQAFFPIWYFQGMERMKFITIIDIFSKIIFTAAIFIFINNESDYHLVPILNGLGTCFGSLYAFWLIKVQFKQSFNWPSLSKIKLHFKDSTEFFMSRVSVSIYTSANVFVLGLFTNNTIVGHYSIAERLYRAIQGFYSPLNQALYPYVAKERNIGLYKKIFAVVLSINLLSLIFIFFFGEWFFSILFSQAVGQESINVFHVFLIANLFAVPSVLIGYPFLGALGYAGFTNKSVIWASIYHIVGLGYFILFYEISIYSVSILFVTTAILECCIRIYGVKKYNLWGLG